MSAGRRRDSGRPARAHGSTRHRWGNRLRVAEAMVLLTLGGAAQRIVPMTWWSRIIGRPAAVPDAWRGRRISGLPVRAGSSAERVVALAVRRAAARLPWKPTCLAEAVAAQVLLRQYGQPGVVVIGLRPTDLSTTERWEAHAWLLGRRGALTGGPAALGFTATTVYEAPSGLRATSVALGDGPDDVGGRSEG